MVRPAEGFLSKDGKFFPTELECEYYEAHLDVYNLCRDVLAQDLHLTFGANGDNYVISKFLDFIVLNWETLDRYVKSNPSQKTLTNDIREPKIAETIKVFAIDRRVNKAAEDRHPDRDTETEGH